MTDIRTLGYICSDCAAEHGGKWPEGRQTTWHEGVCECCGESRSVTGANKWNWPKGRKDGKN